MNRIPVLRARDVLLVSVQTDLDDQLVQSLQEDVLATLDKRPARGVVIDVSSVSVVDTFTARAIAQTAQMAQLMGASTVVSGLQPAVVMTLTEMGFTARGFMTALDIDGALDALEEQHGRA